MAIFETVFADYKSALSMVRDALRNIPNSGIFDQNWDKKGVNTAMKWTQGVNDGNMGNPSGFWQYQSGESQMIFNKVKGKKNMYSIEVKLYYSYSTSGKGAAEGQKDQQVSETFDTGVTVQKVDNYTYQSKNIK